MKEKKILIVDADKEANETVASAGRNFNFKVGVVPKGKGIVNALLENAPDLMILSLELPDGDGLEIYKEIRAQKELKKIPIVLTSKKELSESATILPLCAFLDVQKVPLHRRA